MRIFLAALLAAFSGLCVHGQALSEDCASSHVIKVIKAGRLIDPAMGAVLENVVILVDHNSVKAIGKDPLKDIRALENVAFVMKGGTVYKRL